MAHRDRVHEARETEREQRHVQPLAIDRTRFFEQLHPRLAEDAARHVEWKLVVTGRHRRVRREDALLAHRRNVDLRHVAVPAPVTLALEERQRQQRRMSLIDVMDDVALVA